MEKELLTSGSDAFIEKLREIGLGMTWKERFAVVGWNIKFYLRHFPEIQWKEILLTVRSLFQHKKYAVWFGCQKGYYET